MDIMKQLAEVKDLQTRTIAGHAMRLALQHNIVADNTAAMESDDPAKNAQIQAAVSFHRDTADLITDLVNRVISAAEKKEAAPKKAIKKK